MRIIILDTKNRVVDNINRYQGTVNSSVRRAAEIFRPAIVRNCPGVIICHNHRRKSIFPKIRTYGILGGA